MAREACLSLSRFSREFHREIGVTYWDYLTDLRMEQAKRLLAGPSLSLQEIARRVGYRTPDTFSRRSIRPTVTNFHLARRDNSVMVKW